MHDLGKPLSISRANHQRFVNWPSPGSQKRTLVESAPFRHLAHAFHREMEISGLAWVNRRLLLRGFGDPPLPRPDPAEDEARIPPARLFAVTALDRLHGTVAATHARADGAVFSFIEDVPFSGLCPFDGPLTSPI
jgi:hypothetical protein